MREPATETAVETQVLDARPLLDHPRRELARRVSGGIEITLYWSAGDDSTTLEVCQPASGETLLLSVAREQALDAFYHPFAHVATAADDRTVGRMAADHRSERQFTVS